MSIQKPKTINKPIHELRAILQGKEHLTIEEVREVVIYALNAECAHREEEHAVITGSLVEVDTKDARTELFRADLKPSDTFPLYPPKA